jgi:aminopeptidase N
VESFGPIIWGSRLRSSLQPAAWRIITYEKGAWVMHMLRRRLGDDNFLKMLGALRKQHEFRPVSTDQFRELAAGFLPPDYSDPQLESLFGQYVYDTGIPELQMTHKMVRQGARWRVSGQVTQSGVGDDFTVLAPIEVHFAKGGPQTVWVRTTTDEPAVWQVTVAQQPVRVLLDPGRSVLSTRR